MKHNYFSILIIFALSITSITASNLGGNDNCIGAIDLTCGDSITGTTEDNTDTGANPAPDEFYKYTGSGVPEEITISLCDDVTDYDSYLRVFTDCTLTTEVVENDDACGLQSEVSFLSDGTATYYIMVEGFQANSGPYQLDITCVSTLTNDGCNFATPITCGDAIVGETTTDTDSGFNPSPDEFFIFTGDGFEQDVTVTMCDGGTDYDSFLRVFNSCDFNNQIVNNDDSCGLVSEVTFTSDGVSSYIIMVEGFQDNSGNFSLSISCSGPPIPPPNDLIENSINVNDAGGFPYTDAAVISQDATPETGETIDCSLAGLEGVWYHFTAESNIMVTGSIATPNGLRAVIFYSAPNTNAVLEDLTRVDQDTNPCFTGDTASVDISAGQTVYAFFANKGLATDFTLNAEALSIADNAFNEFSFYPNPANNTLNLSAASTIENARIVNVLGQTIANQNVNAMHKTIDVSVFKAGNYFIEVTINGATNSFQFIKE